MSGRRALPPSCAPALVALAVGIAALLMLSLGIGIGIGLNAGPKILEGYSGIIFRAGGALQPQVSINEAVHAAPGPARDDEDGGGQTQNDLKKIGDDDGDNDDDDDDDDDKRPPERFVAAENKIVSDKLENVAEEDDDEKTLKDDNDSMDHKLGLKRSNRHVSTATLPGSRATNDGASACQQFPLTCHDQERDRRGLLDFSRVMVVVAHPDDAATCAGGTVALLVSRNVTVRYVVLTSGNKGSHNLSMTSAELAIIRQQEQLNAAAVLGVASVDFLHVDDGELIDTMVMRGRLTKLIRTYQPEAVLTWDPEHDVTLYSYYLEHRDHRAAGQIALDCCYPTARDFLYFPEQYFTDHLAMWNVQQVYLFSWRWWQGTPGQNYVVDISDYMNLKIKSMLEHKSQVGSNAAAEIVYLEGMAAALAQATPDGAPNITSSFRTQLYSKRSNEPQTGKNTWMAASNATPLKFAEWFKRVLMPK